MNSTNCELLPFLSCMHSSRFRPNRSCDTYSIVSVIYMQFSADPISNYLLFAAPSMELRRKRPRTLTDSRRHAVGVHDVQGACALPGFRVDALNRGKTGQFGLNARRAPSLACAANFSTYHVSKKAFFVGPWRRDDKLYGHLQYVSSRL